MLAYLRRYKDETVLVVLNMSASEQKVSFDLKPHGISSGSASTILTTLANHPAEVALSQISLAPFAVYIGKVGK